MVGNDGEDGFLGDDGGTRLASIMNADGGWVTTNDESMGSI